MGKVDEGLKEKLYDIHIILRIMCRHAYPNTHKHTHTYDNTRWPLKIQVRELNLLYYILIGGNVSCTIPCCVFFRFLLCTPNMGPQHLIHDNTATPHLAASAVTAGTSQRQACKRNQRSPQGCKANTLELTQRIPQGARSHKQEHMATAKVIYKRNYECYHCPNGQHS